MAKLRGKHFLSGGKQMKFFVGFFKGIFNQANARKLSLSHLDPPGLVLNHLVISGEAWADLHTVSWLFNSLTHQVMILFQNILNA